MLFKCALIVCLQAILIQGFSAQCIGAYNGLAAAEALPWPASNALALNSAASWGAASPCAASAAYAAGVAPLAAAPWDAAPWAAAPWEATPWAAAPWDAAPWTAAPWDAAPWAAAPWAAAPFPAAEWGVGYSPASLAASNGGGLAITSSSPIAPTGVTMNSENIYEGPLAVSGAMPFLGAVALEGVLPTGGAGSVAYGCGNGNVAIINEDYTASIGPLGYGAGIASPAYGYNGLAGPVAIEAGIAGPAFGAAGARFGSCGCGAVY